MFKIFLLCLVGAFPNSWQHPEYHYTYRYRPLLLYQNQQQILPAPLTFLQKLRNNSPLVECFQPKGIRMSISDMPEMESVQYEFINTPGLNGLQQQLQRPINGRWLFTNNNFKINLNDELRYRIHCKGKGQNHVIENHQTITNLIPRPNDLDFPSIPHPEEPSNLCPSLPPRDIPPVGFCPCPSNENIPTINNTDFVESRIDLNPEYINPKAREETTEAGNRLNLNPDDPIDLEVLGKDLMDAKEELSKVRKQLEDVLKLTNLLNFKESPENESSDINSPETATITTIVDKFLKSLSEMPIDEIIPDEAKNVLNTVSPKKESSNDKTPEKPKSTSSTTVPSTSTKTPPTSTKTPASSSTTFGTQPISSPSPMSTSTEPSTSTNLSTQKMEEETPSSSTTQSSQITPTTSPTNPTSDKSSPSTEVPSTNEMTNSDPTETISTNSPLTSASTINPTVENNTPTTEPSEITTAQPETDAEKELKKLRELLKATEKQLKRRNLELVLVNNKPSNKTDAMKELLDFIRDELKLKDFEKKITKAEYTKCGILFETQNPEDKILILEKVNEHLPIDSKFQVTEPDFDDPNCNFSKDVKMEETLVIQRS